MATLTSDEANALLQLRFGDDFTSALGKLRDIVLNLIWLDVCQCTSGTLTSPTLPTTPTDAPVFVPPSLTPGPVVYGNFYPMLRSQTKVLTLGGGTPARPTGWTTEAFNDSAWVTGVAPSGISRNWSNYAGTGTTSKGYTQNTEVSTTTSLPGAIEAVGPASPIAHNYEQFLVRWRVYIGDETPARAIVRWGSFAQAGPGWTSGSITNNGGQNVAPPGSVDSYFFAQRIVPNAWNLFCFDVDPSNTSNANVWGTEGGIFFGLDFTSSRIDPNVTPCCPPDPITQAYLDNILAMVTLVQRQVAPFAYVYGDNHTALSGQGSFGVSGLLGVSVDVTTLPDSYGRTDGEPDELYGLGFVTLGTADGYGQSRRVDHDGSLFLPRAAGLITTVGYSLAPGVVVSVRELLREP